MLGLLDKEFLIKFKHDQEIIRQQFESLTTERNRLMHHFCEDCGRDFQTKAGCDGIVVRLKAQYAVVREFNAMLIGLCSGMMTALCESTCRNTPEYEEFKAECIGFASHVDPGYLPEMTIELVDLAASTHPAMLRSAGSQD
jgi:hypothetical protein